jgi:hypothetical protein
MIPPKRGIYMALQLLLVPVLLALTAFAGDEWDKVRELPSGSDLKIYERGSAQPKTAKYADVTDSSLIIIVKNEQVAISKDVIDRIDARPPAKKGAKRKVVQSTRVDDPAQPSSDAGPHGPTAGSQLGTSGTPGYSSSTSVVYGGDGDFNTVYRRASGAPPQKPPAKVEPK